jgi:phosphate transport system permease protein
MTAVLTSESTPGPELSPEITRGRLGKPLKAAIALAAAVVGVGVTLVTGDFKWGWALIVAAIAYVTAIYVVSRVVEDRRQAIDGLASAVMTTAFVLVMVPLISVAWTVLREGAARFDTTFFSHTMELSLDDLAAARAGDKVGGVRHAVIGTLIVTGMAGVLSVPFGMFTAIYLVEYGKGRLARAITSMVDVMTGIPSIVAGLFAYALFVIFLGPGSRTGLAAAVALTLLMTPVVVRSTEEMLRLVPNELREAAFALGVPKWKTIVKVVIPTAIAGILTGVTLAVARVIGETAPLLVTAGIADGVNENPFSGRMTTLPVYTYRSYKFPSQPTDSYIDRAWAAALTLVVLVAVLFTVARILAAILKPKGLK